MTPQASRDLSSRSTSKKQSGFADSLAVSLQNRKPRSAQRVGVQLKVPARAKRGRVIGSCNAMLDCEVWRALPTGSLGCVGSYVDDGLAGEVVIEMTITQTPAPVEAPLLVDGHRVGRMYIGADHVPDIRSLIVSFSINAI